MPAPTLSRLSSVRPPPGTSPTVRFIRPRYRQIKSNQLNSTNGKPGPRLIVEYDYERSSAANLKNRTKTQSIPDAVRQRDTGHANILRIEKSVFVAPGLEKEIAEPFAQYFQYPGRYFNIPPANSLWPKHWAVIGPSKSKLAFLKVLRGEWEFKSMHGVKYSGRRYPLFVEKGESTQKGIALVEFTGSGLGETVRGEYMSSRYESRREANDITLREWLRRTAEGLPLYTDNFDFDTGKVNGEAREKLNAIAARLKLDGILEQPVSTLSNGQGRRARIAQALLRGVDLLLLDEPFMGLDPPSTVMLSNLLNEISSPPSTVKETDENSSLDDILLNPAPPVACQVVLGLRPEEPVPSWISHVIYIDEKHHIIQRAINSKSFADTLNKAGIVVRKLGAQDGILHKAYASAHSDDAAPPESEEDNREVLVDMKDVRIAYRGKEILRDFSWKVKRGDRWGLFGPNGSGKTTILSLVTSDHPQSYSLPILIFGHSRLPLPGVPGISIFDIQARIGQSSPEIHQFFPKSRTLRQCVESAFADTFLARPDIPADGLHDIDELFTHFDITPEMSLEMFGGQSVSMQKLVLFMRAVVKQVDIVVLDEAFSGMDRVIRDRCMKWLEDKLGEDQALVCVSHLEEEVPTVVNRWVRLSESGTGERPVFGER